MGGTSTLCSCNEGFQGDGFTCNVSIPTCGNYICDPNAVCMLVGEDRRTCVCKSGFERDGLTCSRVDLCTTANCDLNATCTTDDTTNTATCTCNPDFTGDGVICAPFQVCNETCLTIQADLHCVVLREVIECTSPRVQRLFRMVKNIACSVFANYTHIFIPLCIAG